MKRGVGMKLKVPKCKECEYHKCGSAFVESSSSTIDKYLKHRHYCTFNKERFPVIYSNELRTSPNWCPKR